MSPGMSARRRGGGPRSSVEPLPWIARWLRSCHELAVLERSHPMTDAVIDAVDGRRIRIGDRRLSVMRRFRRPVVDGGRLAGAYGTSLRQFELGDPAVVGRQLAEGRATPRLACMDGVSGMTRNPADLAAVARNAREHDALLYVD